MVAVLRRSKPTNSRRPTISTNQAPVFSYYAKRTRESDQVRQYSSTASRQAVMARQWLRNLPTILAVIMVLASLAYSTGLSSHVSVILPMSGQAISLRNKADYQAGAQKIMQQSWLNQSKLTFNTTDFANQFTATFPEVATVSVALPLVSRNPVILIQTARPVLVITSGGQAYVVDNRGVAMIKAHELISSVRDALPIVHDETGLNIKLGQKILSKQYIDFITTISQQLAAKHLAISSITLPAQAQQINVRLADQPYVVKYNVATDARQATGSFLAVKQKLESEHAIPTEYIDVRVEERTYVK